MLSAQTALLLMVVNMQSQLHAESTTDQAPTPHAELLLMRVLAQSAIAANGLHIQKSNNENTVLTVFAWADLVYGQMYCFPISCN